MLLLFTIIYNRSHFCLKEKKARPKIKVSIPQPNKNSLCTHYYKDPSI